MVDKLKENGMIDSCNFVRKRKVQTYGFWKGRTKQIRRIKWRKAQSRKRRRECKKGLQEMEENS